SAIAGAILRREFPWPYHEPLLDLIQLERPLIYNVLKWAYLLMLYTTPLILFSGLASLRSMFGVRWRRPSRAPLPPYPPPAQRRDLFLVIGELHHPTRVGPSGNPRWLVIPDRRLCTGIAVFGAIGSGKTTCCMYPFANQLLAWRAQEPAHKIGALILEVKGSFCYQARQILAQHKRAADYLEIGMGSKVRYNPLHNDLHPYVLAYAMAALLNNIFGRGHEPFWHQANTDLVMWTILRYRPLYDYVTLFDAYRAGVDPEEMAARLKKGAATFQPRGESVNTVQTECVLVTRHDYLGEPTLNLFPF